MRLVCDAVVMAKGRMDRAAETLAVTKRTLYRWLKQYPEIALAVCRGRELKSHCG